MHMSELLESVMQETWNYRWSTKPIAEARKQAQEDGNTGRWWQQELDLCEVVSRRLIAKVLAPTVIVKNR